MFVTFIQAAPARRWLALPAALALLMSSLSCILGMKLGGANLHALALDIDAPMQDDWPSFNWHRDW